MTFDQLVARTRAGGQGHRCARPLGRGPHRERRLNRSRARARYRYYEGSRSGPAVTAERREILLEGLIDLGSRALHDRLEPAEPHPNQFPNTGLSIRPFVDHREPLRLFRAQRQNDPSSGFDLIEDRRRQSLGGGRQQGSIVGRVLAPATRPVSDADGDIGAAELAQVASAWPANSSTISALHTRPESSARTAA